MQGYQENLFRIKRLSDGQFKIAISFIDDDRTFSQLNERNARMRCIRDQPYVRWERRLFHLLTLSNAKMNLRIRDTLGIDPRILDRGRIIGIRQVNSELLGVTHSARYLAPQFRATQ